MVTAHVEHRLIGFFDHRLLYPFIPAQILVINIDVFEFTGEGRRERRKDSEVFRQRGRRGKHFGGRMGWRCDGKENHDRQPDRHEEQQTAHETSPHLCPLLILAHRAFHQLQASNKRGLIPRILLRIFYRELDGYTLNCQPIDFFHAQGDLVEFEFVTL